MILDIGFADPFLVGLMPLGLLMALIFVGARVVFAASIVGRLLLAGFPPGILSALIRSATIIAWRSCGPRRSPSGS